MEQHLFATKAEDFSEELKGYVDGSQRDRHGAADSKWPVYTREPAYHDDTLHLRHTESDKENGLRAFCADLMDALPCHHGWQVADGEAMLLQYVSKYVSKFSDSSYDEWMNEKASADSVARRVCFEYHPYEPEMILQLCGAQFRQYDITTTSGGFPWVIAPYAGMHQPLAFVEKYCECSWRHNDMSLLEWLQKTNDDGHISGWLKAKHEDHSIAVALEHHNLSITEGSSLMSDLDFRRLLNKDFKAYRQDVNDNEDEESAQEPLTFVDWIVWEYTKDADGKRVPQEKFPTLKRFACEYVSKGEKLVAVDTVYEFNNRYCGQWLAIHVPFRSLDELWDKDVERLVPSSYKYLATALRICADKDRVPCEFHNLFLDEDKLKN